MISENRNTEIEFTQNYWFGYGIIPIKTRNTELPYWKYWKGKIMKAPKTLIPNWAKVNILKLPK